MINEPSEPVLSPPTGHSTDRPREAGAAAPSLMGAFSIRLLLGYVLAAIFLGGLGWYATTEADYFRALANVRLPFLVAIAAGGFVHLLARTFYLAILVREGGTEIRLTECVGIMGATNLLAAVTLPGASLAFRAAWLRRRHDVRIGQFARGMALFAVVWIVLSASLLIGGVLAVVGPAPLNLAIAAILSAAGSTGVGYWIYKQVRRRDRFGVLAWWPRRLFLTAVVTTLVCSATQAVRFLLAFYAFEASISLGGLSALTAAHQLGGTVGLTPGGVGVQETLVVLLVATIGISLDDTIVVLLTLRAVSFATAILVGGPSWCLLAATRSSGKV